LAAMTSLPFCTSRQLDERFVCVTAQVQELLSVFVEDLDRHR